MRWLPVFLWASLIFFLSSFTNPYQALLPKNIQYGNEIHILNISIQTEKVGELSHLFAYIVFGSLIIRTINLRPHKSAIWLAWGISILSALSDEFHQLFVPGRTFQLMDLAVDSFGSLVGILVYKWIESHQRNGAHLE